MAETPMPTPVTGSCWVDFNEIDQDGQVETLRKFASGPVSAGDTVLCWDHDGNGCAGTVLSVEGNLVRIQVR